LPLPLFALLSTAGKSWTPGKCNRTEQLKNSLTENRPSTPLPLPLFATPYTLFPTPCLAFSAQKTHVKPWKRPNSKIKIRKPNKRERLQAKNKSAKVGILVSPNPLKFKQ